MDHKTEFPSLPRVFGYDEKTNSLEIVFNAGERNRWLDVPPSEWESLQNAESIVLYAIQHIVGKYECERVH